MVGTIRVITIQLSCSVSWWVPIAPYGEFWSCDFNWCLGHLLIHHHLFTECHCYRGTSRGFTRGTRVGRFSGHNWRHATALFRVWLMQTDSWRRYIDYIVWLGCARLMCLHRIDWGHIGWHGSIQGSLSDRLRARDSVALYR